MYIFLIFALLGCINASPALDGCVQSSWYSEEEGYPSDKLTGYPLVGLTCQEDYCDQLMSQQCTTVINTDATFDMYSGDCEEMSWTFSEEEGQGMCPDGMFVESMKCEGRYCDNMRLRCCQPTQWAVDFTNQRNTEWFTDYGSQQCPAMYAVIGAMCSGRFCDDMLLICAPIAVTPVAGKSFGSWSAVCSSNVPDDPCTFTETETVSRERQSSWDSSFSASVDASISAGIIFLEATVGLEVAVTTSVEELVAIGVDTSRSCSTEMQLKAGDSTETVWWQWVMDTDDVSITDPDGSAHKLRMTTCFFLLTSGFDKDPKCTPGYCADADCQLCTI